ncbi:MAG TPA: divalent metal cation transporter [Caproicibacter sp.]|nr:divalent metal cation transporter [Caproicibacter sp.]
MRERFRRPFFIFLFLGPGMLAAMADNDAGGLISYTVTGAKFGWAVFVPLTLCLTAVTYTVQEMAMRLGVASGCGYTRLLRERYGTGWMIFQVAALFLENQLTLLTEFVGMSAGLELLGVPVWAAVALSVGLSLSIAVLSGYKAKERFGLLIGLFNLLFLIFAFFAHPAMGVRESIQLCSGHSFRWYAAALIGNAIAPWMIFYQNCAYVDKGLKKQHIRSGRIDTLIGCICQVLVAASLIFIGSSISGMIPDVENAGAPQIVSALNTRFGPVGGAVFALGLFDSGLLAAVTVSLSSSWSIAESFGWSKSLNDKVREAPGFYGIYAFSVLLAAVMALVPNLRLNGIAVFVQVAGGVLMTPILLFLTLLTSSRQVMGEHANTLSQKIRSWASVGILLVVSVFTIFLIAI